jgi:glucokinase
MKVPPNCFMITENKQTRIAGIDLGGTLIRGAIVQGDKLTGMTIRNVLSAAPVDLVLDQLFALLDQLMDASIEAIGIGVPGLVDHKTGIVSDVVYIPSWKKVALQEILTVRYNLPVVIDNDANCFALGEFYFGKGKESGSMVGLTIGTGLGTGIIINRKLYAGLHGGAGEFGMMDYKDHCYEYYASGQFFKNIYGIEGELVFLHATKGDEQALEMYKVFGTHLGHAIKAIMYALDVELIILGGSVSKSFPFFAETMWDAIKTFAYPIPLKRLRIEVSSLENSAILGAAALYLSKIG